jgi:hypothetical protein
VYRNNAQLVAAASSYDTVELISTRRDERPAAAEQRIARPGSFLGYIQRASRWASPETARSDRRQVLCGRVVVLLDRPRAADRDELYADEKAFFGLP